MAGKMKPSKKLPAQKVNTGKGGGKPKPLSKAPAKSKPAKSARTTCG